MHIIINFSYVYSIHLRHFGMSQSCVLYTNPLQVQILRTLYLFSKPSIVALQVPVCSNTWGSLSHKNFSSDQKMVSQIFCSIFFRFAIIVVVKSTQLHFVYHKQVPIVISNSKHFEGFWLFMGQNQSDRKDFDVVFIKTTVHT